MMLTIGSLFSGIGGLELGLERAGLGPVLWQVEKEEFPRAVLAKHWPDAERFDDVCKVGAAELAPVDLICGGFPCQDISLAGRGEGLAGERSGLWLEYARVIRELRPRWVVIENVAALLSRGIDAVLGTLAALGYDALWDCIPAQAVGAPHRRDRVFMVAWRVSGAERDALREEPRRRRWLGDGRSSPFARHLGEVVADAECLRRNGRTGQGEESAGRGQPADECGELANAERPGVQRPAAVSLSDGAALSGALRDCRARWQLADADGRDLPKWPPPPGDMHAWGRVQADTESEVRGIFDGFSAWLVRTGGGLNADESEGVSAEDLRALRGNIHAKAVREATGGRDAIRSAEVLFAVVRELRRGASRAQHLSPEGPEDAGRGMREMRDGGEPSSSSHRRGHHEQREHEHRDDVQDVPRRRPLGREETGRAVKVVRALRRRDYEAAARWLAEAPQGLPGAEVLLQALLNSLSLQPAVCRLGLPPGLVRNRRHALKGYGNAVVPQVAEVIGRFIADAERDAA